MAVDLITAGVEPRSVSRRLYEDLPFSRLELLQRALATVERHDHGALTVAHLVKKDYEVDYKTRPVIIADRVSTEDGRVLMSSN